MPVDKFGRGDSKSYLSPSNNFSRRDGSISMAGYRLVNVGDPATEQDAATKIYVDTKVTSVNNTVTYQSSSATHPSNPISGDWLIVTSDGTRSTSLKEQWIYDGSEWTLVQGSDAIGNLQSQVNNLPSSLYVIAAVTSIKYSVTSAANAGGFRVSFWTGYNGRGTLFGYADFGYGAGFNGSGSTSISGIPSTWKSCTIKNNLPHYSTPPNSVQFYNTAGQAILTNAITNVNGAAGAQITGNMPVESITVTFK